MKAASPFENFRELASLVVNMTKNEDNNLIEVHMGAKIIGLDNQFIILDQASLRECLYLCDYITGIKLDIPWNRDAYLSEKDKTSTDYNIICKRVSADFFNVEQKIAVGINIPGIGTFDTSENGTETLNGPGGVSGNVFKQPLSIIIKYDQESSSIIVTRESENNFVTPYAVTWSAETYYLVNTTSSGGDTGGITANKEGVCIFSKNNKQIEFAFDTEHNVYLALSRVEENFLMHNVVETVFRIGGKKGLAFWGDGEYSTLTRAPNLIIDSDGNVGINTKSPSARLHVNGAAQFDNGIDITNGNLLVSGGNFIMNDNHIYLKWGSDKDLYITNYKNDNRVWIGPATSNTTLSIGTNDLPYVDFLPGKCTYSISMQMMILLLL